MCLGDMHGSLADLALLIQESPISWMEQQVNTVVTQYLKGCFGLGRPANTAFLNLPCSVGGLNFPCLSSFHKKLQLLHQSSFWHHKIPMFRQIARWKVRQKFRPAELSVCTCNQPRGEHIISFKENQRHCNWKNQHFQGRQLPQSWEEPGPQDCTYHSPGWLLGIPSLLVTNQVPC